MRYTALMDINRMFMPMSYSANINQPTMMGDTPQTVNRDEIGSSFLNVNVCRVQDPQCSTIILPPSGTSSLPIPPSIPATLQPPAPTIPTPPPPPPPLPQATPSSVASSSQIYERIQITKDLLNTVKLQPSFGSPKKIKKPMGMCTMNTSIQLRNTA